MNDKTLSLWTLYDHPTDYPEHYVARRFLVIGPGVEKPVATSDTLLSLNLDALRASMLELGLTMIPRDANDDPKIIETWI